ncbi:MAG: hypothetical protein QOE62_909 [Actinomycetota bacterium]|nr:hypothetical protein [Actinomycetota bacterium]
MNPRARTTNGDDDGFTVIEVVVAMTILLVALLASAFMFSNAMLVSGNTRNRVVAANLATQAMEDVRGLAANPSTFGTIPLNSTALPVQTVNGLAYTITQTTQFVGQSSSTSSCDSPPATTNLIMQVTEVVTWPNMGGTQPVRETTTLSPPVGVYSSSSGSIAAKVYDSTGAVASSINVQVTGPQSVTQQTSSEGCAYFAFLPAGSYTVTVIEGTGVGDQEVVAPAQATSVAVGQTASLQFLYDKPAAVTVTLPAGPPPPASGIPVSVANTGLQPYSQFTFASGTTTASLYPYANGYTVFAGNCTDNNPLGKDTNRALFYPTATPAVLNTPPNGTATAPASLYTVALHVQTSTAVAVPNTTPTADETTTFGVPYTAVCTSGTANGAAPTLGLATTNATGDSVTALPLGHFTLRATCTKPAAPCPTANKVGTVNVWVKPDGVYAVNASGASTTKYTTPITVVVS